VLIREVIEAGDPMDQQEPQSSPSSHVPSPVIDPGDLGQQIPKAIGLHTQRIVDREAVSPLTDPTG
jgi:hypothetical protein